VIGPSVDDMQLMQLQVGAFEEYLDGMILVKKVKDWVVLQKSSDQKLRLIVTLNPVFS